MVSWFSSTAKERQSQALGLKTWENVTQQPGRIKMLPQDLPQRPDFAPTELPRRLGRPQLTGDEIASQGEFFGRRA
jgi:hypothetical protein